MGRRLLVVDNKHGVDLPRAGEWGGFGSGGVGRRVTECAARARSAFSEELLGAAVWSAVPALALRQPLVPAG